MPYILLKLRLEQACSTAPVEGSCSGTATARAEAGTLAEVSNLPMEAKKA